MGGSRPEANLVSNAQNNAIRGMEGRTSINSLQKSDNKEIARLRYIVDAGNTLDHGDLHELDNNAQRLSDYIEGGLMQDREQYTDYGNHIMTDSELKNLNDAYGSVNTAADYINRAAGSSGDIANYHLNMIDENLNDAYDKVLNHAGQR